MGADGAASASHAAFFYVGGILLTLLFIADACLPKLPVANGADGASCSIRIHSDRKWPERVVSDNSFPIITSPQGVDTEQSAVSPATITSGKPREQEAFAQLRLSDADQLKSPEKRERKLQRARLQNDTCRRLCFWSRDNRGLAGTAIGDRRPSPACASRGMSDWAIYD